MGIPSEGQPLDESCIFEVEPEQFPYGHSKHLAEQEVRQAAAKGLSTVIVNPSIVLGPRDVNLISGAIVAAVANPSTVLSPGFALIPEALVVAVARVVLRFTPPGGANFVDVSDVVAGHIAAAEKGRSGERYILGGANLPYSRAIPIICEVVGRPPPLIQAPSWLLPPAAVAVRLARTLLGNRIPVDERQVRMMAHKMYARVEKARRDLDLPQTPFRIAVQRTYNWYNENGYLDGAP
jgi:dihydroflavonol-4-reductase